MFTLEINSSGNTFFLDCRCRMKEREMHGNTRCEIQSITYIFFAIHLNNFYVIINSQISLTSSCKSFYKMRSVLSKSFSSFIKIAAFTRSNGFVFSVYRHSISCTSHPTLPNAFQCVSIIADSFARAVAATAWLPLGP